MDEQVAVVADPVDAQLPDRDHAGQDQEQQELVDELLVEEVSIDGMCGVY
jgi:mycofactocin precursor